MSEQLSVCKALAAMLRTHGEPTAEEVNFVAASAMELALDEKENLEVQAVLKEGGDYAAVVKDIGSKAMQLYLFRRVVAATLIDEKIEDSEQKVIDDTAKAFGFEAAAVKEYLGWMEEGIAWEKRGIEIASRL